MTIGMQSVDDVPEPLASGQSQAGGESGAMPSREDTEDYWLGIARDAYDTSTDYFDANIRKQLEKNVHAFRSKHAPGSKYNTDQYRFRSKIFRPKVRASIRKAAAACGVAFFSTGDAVSIQPINQSDERQVASAAINQELINYRLDKTIPWFMTVTGAFVDAKVQGVCISKQEWEYSEKEEAGEDGGVRSVVDIDRPTVKLIPAENFRFSASSDWIDPVSSSPFLIHLHEMFIGDIMERMESGGWFEYSESEIMSAISGETDTTRQSRQGNRSDSSTQTYRQRAFETGWVREYVVRHKGQDVVFATLGDRLLLSAPTPLKDVYHHGLRPFAIGFIDIEPHKCYPSGSPELVEGLQIQANDIANQRLDNVKLALNKRFFGKRGRSVDWEMLKRSVPGGIVMMDDFDSVKEDKVSDVTSSAYAEQDRVNMDMDEILGAFSPSSVASNRKLNETVGGMNLLNEGANALTEFELRIFSESWVEKVLRQLMLLEQHYENDAVVLGIAGAKADAFQKFGIDQVTDDILKAELSCRVNVGFGSTNPQQRIERMALALNAVGQYVPNAMARLDEEAVITEVMGAVGYKDGSRFFKKADEAQQGMSGQYQQQIQQMQAEIQRLQSGIEVANIRAQATVQAKQLDVDARLQDSQMDRMAKAEAEHIRGQYAMEIASMNGQLDEVNTRIKAADSETKRGELRLQANALQFEIAQQEHAMNNSISQAQNTTGINQLSPSKAGTIINDQYGNVPHANG